MAQTYVPRVPTFTSGSDIFGLRNFIENKGQFSNPVNPENEILYAYNYGTEIMYFTRKGIVFEIYERFHFFEKFEEGEEEEQEMEKEWANPKRHYVTMTWKNANPFVVVEASEKQNHYITYGAPGLNSYPYKKLTFKNVYNNIDIVFSIPEDKNVGVKYDVILHKGANPADVALAYDGAVKKMKTQNGDVIITTPVETIIEHAPSGFYSDGEKAPVSYQLKKNVITFNLPPDAGVDREFVIDPWITAVTTLSTNNVAYDIDYDFAGNTYIYGGTTNSQIGRCKEAKYNNAGVLLWTFSGIINTPAWNTGTVWSSNFKINRGSGKSYLGRNQGGPNLTRLDANGNWDNFFSSSTNTLNEVWHVEFDCGGDVMVFGGLNTTYLLVHALTGTTILGPTVFNPNISGCCQDVVAPVFDAQGDCYVYFLGHTQLNHNIVKVAPGFTNTTWAANSGFTVLQYLQNKTLYAGATAGNAVAFNALAVNNNFIFYYDGLNVAAYNKANGSMVGSTTAAGHTGRAQGGIAVDDCNNVYVGGIDEVRIFHFNGTNFSTLTPLPLSVGANAYVTDIQINKFNNTLYICGNQFVGTYSAIASSTCPLAQIQNPCSFGANTITAVTNSINCANLGSATITALGGLGPYSYTWLPSGVTNSAVNNLAPGMYTVIVLDQGLNYTYTTYPTFYPLVPLTGTVGSSGAVACHGANTATADVQLSGGSGNQTYTWTNGVQSFNTPTISNIGAGIWTVTVKDALTSCVTSPTFSIYQPNPVGGFVSASSPTACAGGTINLNANPSGGTPPYTFTWVAGPNTQTRAAIENAGTYNYSVTVNDQYGCNANAVGTLTFVPNPTISVANLSVCPSQIATLTAQGAINYTWNGVSTGSSYTTTPAASSIYTIVGEAALCYDTITASVIIQPVPNPLATSNSPRCENSNLLLFAGGGSSYKWSGPQGFTSSIYNPTVSGMQVANAGVYHVTVTSANGCTAATSTTVSVNLNPTVTASSSTVCTTQTLALYANSAAGNSYDWTGPGGFTSGNQNPTISKPTVGASGQYIVTVTSPQNCMASAVTSAQVISPPSINGVLSGLTLCAQPYLNSPSTVTLTTFGGVGYTLAASPLLQVTGTGPFMLSPAGPLSMVTPVSMTLTGTNGICTSTTSNALVIRPNPAVSVNSLSPEVCNGDAFTFSVSGALVYFWTPDPSLAVYSDGSAFAKPNMTHVYSVYGTSLGCSSPLVTPTLIVHPIPDVSITPVTKDICIGTSATLTAYGNATTYKWSPPNGLDYTGGTIVTAKPLQDQLYVVVGTANGCTASATSEIRVLPLPQPRAMVSTPSLCLGGSAILTGQGGSIYKWTGPNMMTFEGQTVQVTASSGIYSGEYTLTAYDLNGCSNDAVTSINVIPLPNGTLMASPWAACVPFCSQFTFAPAKATEVMSSWKIGSRTFAGPNFSYCVQSPGSVEISGKLTDAIAGCESVQNYTVTGVANPVADFNWLPEKPIERMNEVFFESTTKGEISNWTWHFSHNRQTAEGKSARVTFDNAGIYAIVLTVKNPFGCSDTVIKSIRVEEDFLFFIPNAFTPNHDNLNEVFMPSLRGVERFTMTIYDRWGEQIFHTSDPTVGWDGTYRGKPCKSDVYVYKVMVVSVRGEQKEHVGQVTLYR